MKLINIFLILFTPLSILAQGNSLPQLTFVDSVAQDTIYYNHFINKKDSTISLRFQYKTEMAFFSFKIYDSLQIDSVKQGLLSTQIKHKIIDYKNKTKLEITKRDSTIKALTLSLIPDFDAPDTSGFKHRPSQYLGRVLILHFFNFWDYSFNNEIPVLNNLIDRYHGQGLEILSFVDIGLTDSEKRFLSEKPVHFPLITHARRFMQQFLPIRKSTPYLVIVDKLGRFRYFYINNELNKRRETMQNDGSMLISKISTDYGLEEKIKLLLSE
jgi:hypothetical protein